MANETSNLLEAGRNALPYLTSLLGKLSAAASAIHFENPKMLYLIFPALILFVIPLRGRLNKRKKIFLISRTLILILVLAAASQPYTLKEEDSIEKKSTITVLLDNSESLSLFPNARSIGANAFAEIKKSTEKYTTESDVKLQYFGGGNRTDLWDALYKTILGSTKENNVVVLVSDGISNQGKDFSSVARLLSESNTTVYPILPGPSYADTGVSYVYAAAKTPVESDYEMLVEVRKTGVNESRYDLKVYVDGKQYARQEVRQENDTEYVGFTVKFKNIGLRRVEFELSPAGNDFFEANNRFTKIVEVVEKPRILVISKDPKSPLGEILGSLYNVTKTGSLARDYSPYSAVVIDNFDANALDANLDELRDYITQGNGLIVVGGNNSYDQGSYNNSLIENLLPVRSREKTKEKRKPITFVFLIDTSDSVGLPYEKERIIDVSKAIAIKIIKDLDMDDRLGVIAFTATAIPVSTIKNVSENRDAMINSILRFQPPKGGGTDPIGAFEMADDFLKDEVNEKYVILISDGEFKLTKLEIFLDKIDEMKQKGTKFFIVGIRGGAFGDYLNALLQMAKEGDGIFIRPEEYNRLKLVFTREGEEETGKVGLYVSDPYHFITRNIKVSGTEIADYNNVREKLNAQVLISTEGGSPVLTVWRFGLGRVASITTDDGLYWAQELYSKDAAKLIPSATNWVIGDIEGRKNTVVEAEDTFLGDETLVIARSENPPKAKVTPQNGSDEDLPLKRVGVNLYSAEYQPKDAGIYVVSAASADGADSTGFAVNYPKEYAKTGVDLESLNKLAKLSQGRLYTSGESITLTQDVIYDVKNRSETKSREKKPAALYFLAAALGVYFIDACSRRITEIIHLTRD